MAEWLLMVSVYWTRIRRYRPFQVIDDPIHCLVFVWPGGKDNFLWKLTQEDDEEDDE